MANDPPDWAATKPHAVRRAVTCLAWSTAGAGVMFVAHALRLRPSAPGTSSVGNLITFALLGIVTSQIDAGRGWARWLFVVTYVLGSLAAVLLLLLKPELFRVFSPLSIASAFLQTALQSVALGCLLAPSSRAWFRRQRVRATSSEVTKSAQ
jgi:hypothetical protein